MKSSRLLMLAAKPFLFLLEYILKFSAGVIAVIVLGGQGSFFDKLGAGFGSLLGVLQKIIIWPENFTYVISVIEDYNTLTASAFNQRYGGQAINHVMESLNHAVTYLQAVYQNLTHQPFATVVATLISFLTFYSIARTARFIRQRGKGSYLVRKEREIGERIFHHSEDQKS